MAFKTRAEFLALKGQPGVIFGTRMANMDHCYIIMQDGRARLIKTIGNGRRSLAYNLKEFDYWTEYEVKE